MMEPSHSVRYPKRCEDSKNPKTTIKDGASLQRALKDVQFLKSDIHYKAPTQPTDISENTEQILLKDGAHVDCKASPLEVNDRESFSREHAENSENECDDISCEIESFRREPLDALENECGDAAYLKKQYIPGIKSDFVKPIQRIPEQTTAFCKGHDDSFKEFLHCGERTRTQLQEEASDNSNEACDFCKSNAMFMCEYCTFFYCKSCLEKLHPALGPYLSHKVIPVDGENRSEHPDRCREHGLVAQLFCSYCEQSRCTECVKTRCSLHFKGRVSDADIEREKTILVEELEKATTKLGFLERYKEKVQQEITNTQLTGLLRREQIRQEFVSFHDLLVQKEAKMLEQLDQEVNDRVNHVMDTLQTSVNALEMEDAILTTTVTELLQSPDDARFIEEYVKAKDLCHQVDAKVKKFDRDCARDSMCTPCPVLDSHFTMFLEKKQLSEKLNGAMELPKLVFKQKTIFIEKQPLKISEYMDTPIVPPSTEVCYSMQLLQGGKLVYELKTKDLQDMKLNDPSTFDLVVGKSYLLRVTPTYVSLSTRPVSRDQCRKQGCPCHMFLVVCGTILGNSKPRDAITRRRLRLIKMHKNTKNTK